VILAIHFQLQESPGPGPVALVLCIQGSQPPNRPKIDQFFKSRDRNQDGAITREEFIGNPKGRNVPALTKRFTKFDANGDGKLQPAELKR